jgi:hypothetical protein
VKAANVTMSLSAAYAKRKVINGAASHEKAEREVG